MPVRADDAAPRQHVTIPFTSLPGHGHIVVRIRFNDTLTGNFLLDTGSFASLMDERFARKLGIKMARTFRRSPTSANSIEIYDMTIDQMLVGDMSLRNVHMLVVPHRDVPKGGSEGVCAQEEAKDRKLHPEKYQKAVEPPDQSIDGILGMDYLREFAFLIDFEHDRITAWAYGNLQSDDLTASGMDKATVVPLETDDHHINAYFVKVGFETSAGRVVEKEEIDTGAENTMMTPHHADQIKVAVKHQYFAQTFYGCLPFSAGVIDHVDLNGLTVADADIGFTRKAPEGFPLLLGYDIFSRCRVLFDFPARKMYVEAIPDIEKYGKPAAQYSDAIIYQSGPNGEIFLPVQFGDGKPGTAVVDMATDHTILSPETAARLNMALTPMRDENGAPVLYRGNPAQTGKLPLMRFGGTGVAGFSCLISQEPLTIAGKPVDALLGSDFLSGFLPYIDFQNHQVTFLQGRDIYGGDMEKLDMISAATIPVMKSADGLYSTKIQITAKNTLEESFVISTVDQETILSNRVALALNLKPSGPATRIETSFGPVSAAPVALDEFSMAGIDAPDGTKFYMQTDADALPLSILGLDLLSHYRILFHNSDECFYLADPAKDQPATPPAAAPTKS